MKSLISIGAATLATLVFQPSEAKIWRVNNNPGVTADFTTAQAAHDGASAGDTLYLEPSISNYGNLTMNRRLTVISSGNFLDVNPNLQASLTPGRLNSITLNDINATGSVFQCNVDGSISVSGPDNLRFQGCRVTSSFTLNNSDNGIIINNFIESILQLSTSQNIVIANNILRNQITMFNTASATISNNVLNSAGVIQSTLHNSLFQNNIINKNATILFTNCTILNNLAPNTTLPAGNGNVNSVDMTTVFENANGNDDVSFKLKAGGGNPATGAGVGGADCGAFGGSTPFVSGLQPAIPAIYKLAVPASANGNTMNIIFSTRSNN